MSIDTGHKTAETLAGPFGLLYAPGMKSIDVIRYFGTKAKTAAFLGYTRSSLTEWPDVVPELTALRLEKLTAGDLVVDPSMYPKSPIARLAAK